MANEKNLIPGAHPLTVEEASRGGIASGKARAARKTLREELLALLTVEIKDKKSGAVMQTQAALSSALIRKALSGDTKAYEIIRDTIGERPVEKVMLAEVEQEVIDEVERAVLNDTEIK